MGRLRYISNARTGTGGSIVEASTPLQFLDDNAYIYSSTSGQLDLVATDVVVDGNLEVTGTLEYGATGLTLDQHLSGTFTVGVDDTGYDVKFYGKTTNKYWLWDESADKMVIAGAFDIAGNVAITGTLSVSGTSALNGNVTVAADLTVSGTSRTVTLGGSGGGYHWVWDGANQTMTVTGPTVLTGAVTITGAVGITGDITMVSDNQINFRSGSNYIQSSASNTLDIVATTIAMAGNVTISGSTTFGTLGIGSSGSPASYTYGAPDFFVYTTCGATDNTHTAVPSYFYAIMDGGGGVGRALEAVLFVDDVKLGGWSNAIKGKIDFDVTGRITGLASAICAEMELTTGAQVGGTYAPLEIEMVCPATWAPAGAVYSFIYAAVSGSTQTTFDTYGNLMQIVGLSAGSGSLLYNNTLRILLDTTKYYLPLSTEEGTYTTAYPIATTSTTGYRSTATFVPDSARTNYALAVGTTADDLDVDFSGSSNQNFNPIQMNINITGSNPGNSSTTNLIHTLITHSDGAKSNLRLKVADWNIVFDNHLKDAYVIQTEMDISGTTTISGEAYAASFYLDVAGTITCNSRMGALLLTVSGSGAVSANQSRFNVAHFNAVGNSDVDNVLYLGVLGSTATNGIYIENTGTCATGIKIVGTYTTAAISIGSTIGIKSTATFVPDTNKTNYALAVGTIQTALDLTMVTGSTKNFSPLQMNINVIGVAPTTSTINLMHSVLTHAGSNTMGNLRLKCADFTISITKDFLDAYAYQGEIDVAGDASFNEAAIMGLCANFSTGTVTGKLRGLIIQMQGTSQPTDTMGIEIRNIGSGSTIKDGIFINGADTITNGITMWEDITNAFKFEDGAGVLHGGSTGSTTAGYIKIIVGSAAYRIAYLADSDS